MKLCKKTFVLKFLVFVLLLTSIPTSAVWAISTADSDKRTSSFQTSGRIWVAGDSISASHSEEPLANYAVFVHGWGEMLDRYLTDDVQIFNKSISGQSAKYFTDTANYRDIIHGIGKGDFLLIQFGHNDYKVAGNNHYSLPTSTEGSYKWYLKNYYIDPALEAGAMPVLCTSVVCCRFDSNGFVSENQNQRKFANAMKELYTEYCEQGIEIGFIDTYSLSLDILNADISNAKDYYAVKNDVPATAGNPHPSTSLDHVHYSQKGACTMADVITQNLFVLYKDFNRFSLKGVTDGGLGTMENPYQISSAAQLYLIMQDDTKNTSDTYYRLTANLMPAIQKQEWTTVFRANLDGDGHVINNPTGMAQNAFIDVNYGCIENLTLKHYTEFFLSGFTTPFIQDNYGIIRNCTSEGHLFYNCFLQQSRIPEWYFGGFVSRNYQKGMITDCQNHTLLTFNGDSPKVYLGGIAGGNAGTIKNCSNDAVLRIDTSEYDLSHAPVHQEVVCSNGGIAGIASDTAVITDCTSSAVLECYTWLDYETSAVRTDNLVPFTNARLQDYLDSKKPAHPELPDESPQPETPAAVKGDLNDDQTVTLADAQIALRISLLLQEAKPAQMTNADLNQDGSVSLSEVQQILKYALLLIPSL